LFGVDASHKLVLAFILNDELCTLNKYSQIAHRRKWWQAQLHKFGDVELLTAVVRLTNITSGYCYFEGEFEVQKTPLSVERRPKESNEKTAKRTQRLTTGMVRVVPISLVQDDSFRVDNDGNPTLLVQFTNEPDAAGKSMEVTAKARVVYYDKSGVELGRVNEGCWMREFVIVILLVPPRFRSCSYPQDSLTRLQITALNQDRTAIDHNRLARAESFLHQKQIGLAYVIRSPTRPTGSAFPTLSYKCSRSSAPMLCQRLVRTTPGDTALTRMGASSTASARVKASIVPQTLAARIHPLCGRRPATPVVSTIEPSLRICGLAYLTAARAAQ